MDSVTSSQGSSLNPHAKVFIPSSGRLFSTSTTNLDFNIYYQNCRSLKNKINCIQESFQELQKFDALLFCETWLTNNVDNSEFYPFIDYYNLFRVDRPQGRGGGVALFLKKHLKAELRQDLISCNSYEILWCQITGVNNISRPLLLGVYYRPPNENLTVLNEVFSTLKNIGNSNDVILLGDFNLPKCSWLNNGTCIMGPIPEDIKTTINSSLAATNLCQLVDIPTRNNNILDWCFSNVPSDLVIEEGILFSDHKSITVTLPSFLNRIESNSKSKVLIYNNCLWNELKFEILTFDWSFLSLLPLNQAVEQFHFVLNQMFDKFLVFKTIPKNNLPWFNVKANALFKKKKRFHLKWQKTKNQVYYESFKSYRSELKRLLKENFRNYCKDSFKHPAKFWKFVKGKRKNVQKDLPDTMVYNDEILHCDNAKAKAFGNFFQQVYNKPSTEELTYPDLDIGQNLSCLHNLVISRETVEDCLRKICKKKGTDSLGLYSSVLKTCSYELSFPLSYIFNKSLKEGIFPSLWKQSFIKPIPKCSGSGIRHVINYRPISILPYFSKCLEKCTSISVLPHVSNEISIAQFGFMKNSSCETNLINSLSAVYNSLESHQQCDVFYSDFKKAFDSVSLPLLLYKLEYLYNIKGSIIKWFSSYLTNRTSTVKVNNSDSEVILLHSGVPQGSVIGPLLFTLYINDIAKFINSDCFLFADDLKICTEISNSGHCKNLQSDINNVNSWCQLNDIKLNIDKCHVITFGRKYNPINYDYVINDMTLNRVSSIKDLGIFIDHHLTFCEQIQISISKALKVHYLIFRNSVLLQSFDNAKLLYVTLIRPILTYASAIVNGAAPSNLELLENVQKKYCKKVLKHFHVPMPKSYNEICTMLDIPTLADFMVKQNFTLFLKMVSSSNNNNLLLSRINLSVKQHNSRSKKLFISNIGPDYIKRFFTDRMSVICNSLNDSHVFDLFHNTIQENLKALSMLNP